MPNRQLILLRCLHGGTIDRSRSSTGFPSVRDHWFVSGCNQGPLTPSSTEGNPCVRVAWNQYGPDGRIDGNSAGETIDRHGSRWAIFVSAGPLPPL